MNYQRANNLYEILWELTTELAVPFFTASSRIVVSLALHYATKMIVSRTSHSHQSTSYKLLKELVGATVLFLVFNRTQQIFVVAFI